MRVFETADELYTCIGGLFERLKSQTQVQQELASLKLTVRFNYTQPEASMTLVVHDGESIIRYGECNEKPDVELDMTGDVAHHIWLGEINVMSAISKQQIVITGSLAKVIALIPLVKIGVQIYPQHYQECVEKGK